MNFNKNNLVIYTAIIGSKEGELNRQPVFKNSDFKKICFTDNKKLKSVDWELRYVEKLLPEDNHRSQRNFKLRPHLFLQEFQYSLYLDNTVVLNKDINEFIEFINKSFEKEIKTNSVYMPFHSFRKTVLDEFNEVALNNLDDQIKFYEQLRDYSKVSKNDLTKKPFWPAIILRDHSSQDVINFSEIWFAHVNRYSRRDQLSVIPAATQACIEIKGFELDNHSSIYHQWPVESVQRLQRYSIEKPIDLLPINYIKKIEKKESDLRKEFKKKELALTTFEQRLKIRNKVLDFEVYNYKKNKSLKRKLLNLFRSPFSNIKVKKRFPLFILYRSSNSKFGSTWMRAIELAKIINQGSNINCEATTEKTLQVIKNSIIIINKSFIDKTNYDDFQTLKRNGNVICIDFIDIKFINSNIIELCDVLIASSFSQMNFFKENYPEKLVHLITHHVDTRINKYPNTSKEFRIGYFGEISNAKFILELGSKIDIHSIDTQQYQDSFWIKNLENYNAHYVIRQSRDIDGFKPFTKGFLAAKLSANVLAYKNDDDTLHYLTKDYPYLLEDNSLESIKEMLSYMEESYLSKDWRYGLEIMKEIKEKSSNEFIVNQVRDLFNKLDLIP